MQELINQFHNDMLKYHQIRIARGYSAKFIENALFKYGGYETAKRFISKEPKAGFLNLVKLNLLEFSIEALVVKPEYESLFTDKEISDCENLLEKYGYKLKVTHASVDTEHKSEISESSDFNNFLLKYDIKANEQQKIAIKKVGGATLLLAVPGSGKTSVIVSRVGYMVKCCNIPPKNILTLTFTRAAAKEMKDRYIKKFKIKGNAETPHFSTIHSFCKLTIDICETRYSTVLPTLEPSNLKVIRSILSKSLNSYPQETTVRDAAQKITLIKNMMMDSEAINLLKETIDAEFDVLELYNRYTQMMAESNLMDFDDQLIFAYNFLNQYPDLLAFMQNQYEYINVDEAQDTSLIQHKIIQLIASKNNNIFMVGDEDQSIYKFRGAYPKALLDFESIYPMAKILYMETNYRSTETITNAANEFIKQNQDRHLKTMVSVKGRGDNIKRIAVPDVRLQYRYLLDNLRKETGSVAVLYRNNESVIPLLDVLDINNVPFIVREDGMDLFFTYKIVTEIMAYIKLGMNPLDYDSLSQIYYTFGAYLKRECLDYVKSEIKVDTEKGVLEILSSLPGLNIEKRMRISDVARIINNIKFTTPFDAINKIVYEAGYIDRIDRLIAAGSSRQALFQKVNTLLALSMEYTKISDFLRRIEELANYKLPEYDAKPKIVLSTMHASKGLEFDKVIIIDAFDGLLPSEFAMKNFEEGNRDDYEEEVRLFYVAVTRARKHLEFITTNKRFGTIVHMSMFLGQLIDEQKQTNTNAPIRGPVKAASSNPVRKSLSTVPSYTPGSMVEHTAFGSGRVLSVNASIVEVKFSDGVVKKFDANICVAQNLMRVV